MTVRNSSCISVKESDLTLLNDYFPSNVCDWEHGIKDVTGKQTRRENVCEDFLYKQNRNQVICLILERNRGDRSTHPFKNYGQTDM